MRLLLDTQILLWWAAADSRLSSTARTMIEDGLNDLLFSAVSLWEIVIKRGLGRRDFEIEPTLLRRGLIEAGFEEISISSEHAMAIGLLPPLHKDPFDRMLIAQAIVEGATLLSADERVARYPGPIRAV